MNVTEITQLARDIRVATLKSLNHLGFGHYGGSMSVVETLAVLYGAVMKIDPADPDWPERDYFVLSKGHAGPALYSTLAIKGYFPREELNTLNQNGTRLPSHPDRLKTRGVDATTGSLGQGISIAGGMALSHKLARRPNRVFCIVGDGELNEGQCWEAFQFIAHHRLNNLTVFIDWNKQQLDGELEEIINPFDLEGKFRAFGFDVVTVKGDDIAGLLAVVQPVPPADAQPRVVILDSIKGQGVPCLEQLTNSHHLRLTDGMKQTLNEAIHQLEVMVAEALEAARQLEQEGVSAAVIDMFTLKPIDRMLVKNYAEKTRRIVTCENHSIHNGLGSAVAEVLVENCPVPMRRVGVKERYGQVGTQDFLQKEYGLTAEAIVEAAKSLL